MLEEQTVFVSELLGYLLEVQRTTGSTGNARIMHERDVSVLEVFDIVHHLYTELIIVAEAGDGAQLVDDITIAEDGLTELHEILPVVLGRLTLFEQDVL